MSALKDQAAYFYAPADVTRKGVPLDQAVRIGGMVEEGSLRHAEDGVTIDFVVGDETEATIPVRFTGILPGLFKAGICFVTEGGFFPGGRVVARRLLLHSAQKYNPPSQ